MIGHCELLWVFFTRSIGGRSNDLYNQSNYYETKIMKMKTS